MALDGLKAYVFLNGLSKAFESQARAVGAFLATGSAPAIQGYVTLVADYAQIEGLAQWLVPAAERVWLKADGYLPETLLTWAVGFGFDLALFPPGVFGAEMAGRLAARLGGSAVIGLRDLSWRDGQALAKKSVYSQNLSAELALNKKPFCLALSKEWLAGDWSPGQGWSGDPGEVRETREVRPVREIRELLRGEAPSGLLERREYPREAGWDLSKAERLIVAGFGVGDAEGVKLAADAAEALGAEWGVSRPVAMNAWAPLERLVGVSGAMAAPLWAACFGASGAAALLSGISGAKRVASVNVDPEAPILAASDLAVVGEAKAILTELKKLLGR